ncbi:MAG: hypothetical protein EA382_16000 [Spirochaetaceae bacterium]|nr:MAG: hypothetical protein EA382_16000 [Spirochaetaceae bacterium]
MRQYPDLIHWFSWYTRVSIELPIQFEEESEDAQTATAVYADRQNGDDGAKMTVRAIGLPVGSGSDAYRELAREVLALAGHRVMTTKVEEIDGWPAITQVLQARIDDQEIVRHETYAQAENVVFALIGVAPISRREQYLPVFDRAADTARLVLIP